MQPNALGAPTGPAATPGSATDIGERCKHDMLPRHCAFCQVPSKETSSLNAHSLTEWLARLAQATGAGRSLLPEVEGRADRLGVVRPTLHVGQLRPLQPPPSPSAPSPLGVAVFAPRRGGFEKEILFDRGMRGQTATRLLPPSGTPTCRSPEPHPTPGPTTERDGPAETRTVGASQGVLGWWVDAGARPPPGPGLAGP